MTSDTNQENVRLFLRYLN